jgi:hypothetical protein
MAATEVVDDQSRADPYPHAWAPGIERIDTKVYPRLVRGARKLGLGGCRPGR